MNILQIVTYIIFLLCVLQLVRMTIFQVGSDAYTIKNLGKKSNRGRKSMVSVIIPAHNEEKTIARCVMSVVTSDYPAHRLQIIVVDDGSTDSTVCIVRDLKKINKVKNLVIVRQKNRGKGHALNNGIKKYATGNLIMCLDADSYIAKDAISHAVKYFKDRKVAALAANIKIIDDGTILNLIQKVEYILCFQMKRAQTSFNVEYVVGGIGGVYRKSVIEKIGYGDTNTLTEDMDLTMKIIKRGNKKYKAVFGSDVITYTESCQTLSELIAQRSRWKHGRNQTFWKNRDLFFNSDKNHSKLLTWFYLPYLLFTEFIFLSFPFILLHSLFISIVYHNTLAILSGFAIVTFFISFSLLSEETLSIKERAKMLALVPIIYVLFYIITIVEYIALYKALKIAKNIPANLKTNNNTWQHVRRSGTAIAFS